MPGFRPRFFVTQAEACSCGAELALDDDDSHHAARVLRLQRGDECEVVVPCGVVPCGVAVYAATICESAHPVRVRLTARLEGDEAGAAYRREVGLVQALGRPAAMEYVLEKGTEVGASFFHLVRTEGSPKGSDVLHGDRLMRWRRIVREAAKQSKQVVVPSVEVLDSLDSAIEASSDAGILALVLEPNASEDLGQVLGPQAQGSQAATRIALWIGPEGGWTHAESERFSAAGMGVARLGRSVLRTETAGPVAVAVARLALGDW